MKAASQLKLEYQNGNIYDMCALQVMLAYAKKAVKISSILYGSDYFITDYWRRKTMNLHS